MRRTIRTVRPNAHRQTSRVKAANCARLAYSGARLARRYSAPPPGKAVKTAALPSR
ncbi:hypothetical protein D9M69_680590 [compost metagenome]